MIANITNAKLSSDEFDATMRETVRTMLDAACERQSELWELTLLLEAENVAAIELLLYDENERVAAMEDMATEVTNTMLDNLSGRRGDTP